MIFQSTLSVWRATTLTDAKVTTIFISIHALRVESDGQRKSGRNCILNFNPRSPCGERRLRPWGARRPPLFQSTLSVWRATAAALVVLSSPHTFQSTLSVWRATIYEVMKMPTHNDFNPRSPCGERRLTRLFVVCLTRISIHALRVESDTPTAMYLLSMSNFNPRSPCGERP